MEFKDILVTSLIVGLFIFAIIGFMINFGTTNNTSTNINQNALINKMFGNISTELNSSSTQADTARQGYIQETKNPIISTLGFVFNSILAAGNTFMNMGINVFQIIFTFAQEQFGVPPMVSGVLMALLVSILILSIWSVIRAGR